MDDVKTHCYKGVDRTDGQSRDYVLGYLLGEVHSDELLIQ